MDLWSAKVACRRDNFSRSRLAVLRCSRVFASCPGSCSPRMRLSGAGLNRRFLLSRERRDRLRLVSIGCRRGTACLFAGFTLPGRRTALRQCFLALRGPQGRFGTRITRGSKTKYLPSCFATMLKSTSWYAINGEVGLGGLTTKTPVAIVKSTPDVPDQSA